MAFSFAGTNTSVTTVLPGQPTITDYTNAQHAHSGATSGGTVGHSVLTGLLSDNHTQYALLAGRAGGQTLQGGTVGGNPLNLRADGAGGGTISLGSDGGSVKVADSVAGSLSFFAAAVSAQLTPAAAVADATGAAPAPVLPPLGVVDPAFLGAFPMATGQINVITASVLLELNGLRAAMATYGLIV